MSERTDRIKKHFVDIKKTYIAVGVTVVVTAAVTALVMKFNTECVDVTTVQKGYTVTGDINNTINQIIEVQMSRPGNKSFVVQCLESQKTWPSMRSAAEDLGLNRKDLIKHLKGLLPDVDGLHFEKLAEI